MGSFEVCYSFVGFLYVYCYMFMSVLCSVIEVLFSFFVFVNFSNVHVCFVFYHLQFLVFFNINNVHVCFVLRHRSAVQFFLPLYLSTLVMFMPVLCSVMFSFLYFSILLMFFKCSLCILICECIYLCLSSSVVCIL